MQLASAGSLSSNSSLGIEGRPEPEVGGVSDWTLYNPGFLDEATGTWVRSNNTSMGGCYISTDAGEEGVGAGSGMGSLDYGQMNPGDLELLESRVNFMPTVRTARQQVQYTASSSGSEDEDIAAAMYQEWDEHGEAGSVGEGPEGERQGDMCLEAPLGSEQGMDDGLEGGQSYADMPVAPARQLLPAPAAAVVSPVEPLGVRVLQQLASSGGAASSMVAPGVVEDVSATGCSSLLDTPADGFAAAGAAEGQAAARQESRTVALAASAMALDAVEPESPAVAASAGLSVNREEKPSAVHLDHGIDLDFSSSAVPLAEEILPNTTAAAAETAGKLLAASEPVTPADPAPFQTGSTTDDVASSMVAAERPFSSPDRAAGAKLARPAAAAPGSHIPRPGGLIASLREVSPTRIPRLNAGAAVAGAGKMQQGIQLEQQLQEELGAEPQLQHEAQLQQDEMQHQFSIDLEAMLAQQLQQQQQAGEQEVDDAAVSSQNISSLDKAGAQGLRGSCSGLGSSGASGSTPGSSKKGREGAVDYKGGIGMTNMYKDPKEGGLLLTDSLTRAPAGSSEWSIAAWQDQEEEQAGSARVSRGTTEDPAALQCPWLVGLTPGKELYGSDRSPEDLRNSYRAAQRRFVHGSEPGQQYRSRDGAQCEVGEEGFNEGPLGTGGVRGSGEREEHLVLQTAAKPAVPAGASLVGVGSRLGKDGLSGLGVPQSQEQEVSEALSTAVKVPWGATLPSHLPPTSAAFYTTAVYGSQGPNGSHGGAAGGVSEDNAGEALLRTLSSASALSDRSGQRHLQKMSESGRMGSMQLTGTGSMQQGGPGLTTIELFFPDGPESDSAGGWLISTDRSGVETEETLPELASIAEGSTADEITVRASESYLSGQQGGAVVEEEEAAVQPAESEEHKAVMQKAETVKQQQEEETIISDGLELTQQTRIQEGVQGNLSAPATVSQAGKVQLQKLNLVPKPKQTEKQRKAAMAAAAAAAPVTEAGAAPQQAKRRSPVFHVTMALVVVASAVLISQLRYAERATAFSTISVCLENHECML